MTKHLRFLIVLLMTLVWSAGWAQEVTMDFTDNTSWKIPTSQTAKEQKFGTGNNEITLSNAYYYSSNYLMLKKNGTLTFATFTFDVEKIVVTGNLGASSLTKQNIYVGNVAVSSQTIGSTSTNTYLIKDGYQSAGNRYVLKVLDKNAQITKIQIYKKESSSSNKTATKVSFGSNTGMTFTFTEGECADGTFTAPTATETTGVKGTIVYSSDNVTAVKVNASTGALSFPGYGEATITATFTPTNAETYAVSTDSYKVKNERGVVAGTITFDKANGAFENVKGSGTGYISGDFPFVSDSNESFTFKCSNVMKNDGCLQLQYKTDKQGKVESPTFPQFTNGYKVYVVYSSEQPLTLQAGDHNAIGTTTDSGSSGTGAAVSIEVSANGSFVINVGSKYAKISKIEIIPNKIDETETTTLDETATNNNIVAKTGVNVTLKRTMAKGVWNTICLPFEVSEDKAKTAFGAGVKIAVLDTKSTDKTLKFYDCTTLGIPAATPCLIKPSEVKTSNEYVFENVNIVADELTYDTTDGDLAFRGIYNMVDVTTDVKNIGDDYYAAFLGANNTIFKANVGGKMKGFRAYFAIPNGTAASALRVVIDGTATSIKNIDSEVVEDNAPVYNLQGQRVDGSNLTPGIYVKAGKKFVVK